MPSPPVRPHAHRRLRHPAMALIAGWWKSLVLAALVLGGLDAHAALKANWKADTYITGSTWVGTVAGGTTVTATPLNSPVAVVNAFGGRKGVQFSGSQYFTVPAAQNPVGGKTSFTLAAVFRATTAGAAGANWYQASGLIGMEQGGVVNDFGLGWSGDGGARVKAGLGFAGGGDSTINSAVLALNTTHAAVLTYNGTNGVLTLFVDGQQVASANGVANTPRNTGDFALGAITSGGLNPFNGLIAELQMYDSVENGATLSSSLLTAYTSPNLITSFTTNKPNPYEGDSIQLSWTIDTAPITGTLSVVVMRGTTTIYTGAAATNSIAITIPSLAGTAQAIACTLTVTEVGGNGYGDSETVTLNADPGIPIATPQSGISVPGTTPTPITLAASDPNGGTLGYTIVTPPSHGTLTGTGAARTYTALAGYAGPDGFVFKVNDGIYDSLLANVSLFVTGPPVAPNGIFLTTTSIPNTKTTGNWIADIGSIDSNLYEAHSYALVAGEGSIDNTRFSVNGHQLRAAQSMAVPAGTQYAIRLRSTDAQGLIFEQAIVLTIIAPSTGVIINEILYNGVDNTVLDDFIELYNSSTSPVNLTGWRLSSAVDFVFPANTTIAPGGYLVIAESPPVIQSRFGKPAIGPWIGALSSDGETVLLRNAADQIVSEVDYKVGFPWPVSAAGDGTSMELIHPSLDPSLGASWRSATIPPATATSDTATPGAQNLKFIASIPPSVRQVQHTPQVPAANTQFLVTAKVTDPDGVASVQLQYQIVAPGSYLSSTIPKPIVNNTFNATTPLATNPAFEAAASWTAIAMGDDGINSDELGSDGIYTATIPGQPNRTLVRYRIVITDNLGNSVRVPYADDPSLNFACFVYSGVPAYQGTSAETLQTLPVYHFITAKQDYDDCVAYSSTKQLNGGLAWTFENWEAAFVFDGVVYDHIRYRLHGGNGRYYFTGKRAFRFFFNKGSELQNRDNDGNPYPTKWNSLVTQNCWENRATYTFSLNEMVNYYLWTQLGVPSPGANWGHFRTIMTSAEQPDAWRGDFWGLILIQEDYDRRFLDSHNLEKGNLYKLTRDDISGVSQQRYQAPFAVKNGSDHDNIYNSLKGASTPAFVNAHINLDKWGRYHALSEAIRHYDYWPSGDNNGAYYFEPTYTAANSNRGKLWILPNDVDATWGPTWNNGHDIVHNALFNDTASTGGDSATNPTLWPQYFNAVREVRDLLWQQDQINPIIDQFAAVIQPFANADFKRWYGAPSDAGNFSSLGGPGMSSSIGQTSLANLVTDMKNFAWVGGNWPGGAVAAGGRAAYLDTLQLGVGNSEGSQIPAKPTITYVGGVSHAVNDLRFQTTAFSDPQGAGTFAAIQWRIAEITDSTAPAYVPGEKRKLEWNASYDSGEITTFAGQFRFPASSARAGHTYRARVRHKDVTGRWSHWSSPVQFTAAAADVTVYVNSLVVSEFMYHPTVPTPQETALGYEEDDFEYIELRNVSATSVDLTDVRFTKGIDFDFTASTTLAAGASILVVRNTAAFNHRYGGGKPIAGSYGGDSLKNLGEEIKLSFGAGAQILVFAYSPLPQWPVEADTLGYSLVLIAPETRPNPASPSNWRTSRLPGGNPASDDRVTFQSWSSQYGALNANDDNDGDGVSNWLEFALSSNPTQYQASALPSAQAQTFTVAGIPASYLTITFNRQLGAEELAYHAEFSSALSGWSENGVRISSTLNGNGTVTETWRSATPISNGPQMFARLRVSGP